MKLRTATPASIPLITKLVLVLASILIAVAVPIQMTKRVSADQYDDKINALQQDIDNYNAEAKRLAAHAVTLQSAVAGLKSQAAVIQAQIDISQAKHDKLVVQIADTEQKIKDNKNALGETIAKMYVEGDIEPIEMLASSNNISDYLDKQEYRASVRDQLTSTISEIKDLKTKLDKQKVDVVRVLGDQQNSKNALVAKQKEQQYILNQTKGEEAAYQQLVTESQARQAQERAKQQAYLASLYNSGGGATLITGGAAPDYPWDITNCAMGGELGKTGNLVYYSYGGSDGNGHDGGVDSEGFDGYGCRQCASYVAWRVDKETGNYPENWGNATNFPESAESVYGASVVGYTPRAHSIGVIRGTTDAPEGHVAWIESVNDDGTLTVSQYNYNYNYPSPLGWGLYSKMIVPASSYNIYIYIPYKQ